ncbi:MAG: sensor histidine kinase [bacterium]|nr:sensor histidine kinase [bacterium]
MDTKLKNRHKVGILLIFCIVVSAAALMTSAFPMIRKEADRMAGNSQNVYEDDEVENICAQMLHWPYALWMQEQEEEAGKVLTPAQVLAPGLLEKTSSYALGDMQSEEAVPKEPTLGETHAEGVPSEGIIPEGTDSADLLSGQNQSAGSEAENILENQENLEEQEYLIQIKLEREEESRAAEAERMNLLQEMRRSVDNAGRMWQTNLREWQNNMQYKVLDEQNQVLRSGGEAAVGDTAGEWICVQMHYGEQGVLDGVYLDTSQEEWKDVNKSETVRVFEKNLTEYYYKDVLQEYFSNEGTDTEVQFSGPKNRTFEFTIPVSQIFNHDNTIYYRGWHYEENGVYLLVLLALAAYVTLAAILLPCISSFQLGRGKISRLPFELVVLELGMTASIGYIYGAALFFYIANGQLPELIAEVTAWPPETAYWAAMAMCMLYWVIVFALGYWGVHCFRAIFGMGLKRYLKERTITGRILCWFFKKWLNVYHAFREVDLEKQSTKTIVKVVLVNFVVLAVISCFWMFGILFLIIYSIVLFFLLMKYWKKVQEKYEILLKAVKQMADGKLDTKIPDDLGIFESLKDELQKVQKGFRTAVEEETRSQRMKTELITNVSHDLKTPLTAIVTYVNLLKQENITEEERNSYIEILDKKSMRLKTLIEDLFEVSKAASRTVKLNLVEVDIVSLLKQVRLELADRLKQSGVIFRWDFPDEKVTVMLDSDKTYRIFENLLINIAKYAMPGTRAYIEVGEEILSEEKEEDIQSAAVNLEKAAGKKKLKEKKKGNAAKNDTEHMKGAEGMECMENMDSEKQEAENENQMTSEDGIELERDAVDTQTAENFKTFLHPVKQKKRVWISMKNISSTEIHVNPEELTERFVRGDESRNTEGSGLGLAIAKNFVEVQNGTMNVEVEADLFKVRIEWET